MKNILFTIVFHAVIAPVTLDRVNLSGKNIKNEINFLFLENVFQCCHSLIIF